MKKFVLFVVLLAAVICCVSCSANTTNAESTANVEYTKAGELKTCVIYGYIDNLDNSLNAWLLANSQVQIVDIQYTTIDRDGIRGSALVIYKE